MEQRGLYVLRKLIVSQIHRPLSMYTVLYYHVVFNIATEELKLYAGLLVCDNYFPSNWYILNKAASTNGVSDTAWAQRWVIFRNWLTWNFTIHNKLNTTTLDHVGLSTNDVKMKTKCLFKLEFSLFLCIWLGDCVCDCKWRRSRNSCVNTLCQCWRQAKLCCRAISSSTVASYTNEIGVSFLTKPVIFATSSKSAQSRFWRRQRHDDVCSAKFNANINLNRRLTRWTYL